jgi:tight adherence protein C
VTVALLTGLVVGAGLWLVASGLRPAPEPLGEALARIARPPATPRTGTELDERDARVGAFLLERIPPLARRIESVRADLRVVGRPPEEQAIRAAACVLLPLLLGPWVAIVAGVSGLPLPPTVAGTAGLVASALGVVVPFAALRAEARERRAAFAHALSAWCDVVVMTLAAGRGVEQAMETAAGSGEGWAFAEIRGALHGGYVRGEPPWVALGRLGDELGVTDLSELAGTIALAGEEGAAVRATVAAKARTIRERISTDTEVAAATATERMSLPSVLLVLGFLVFLCYPAIVAVFDFTT